MTKVIIGDLVRDAKNYDAIAHGCNCFNTMGAGIAAGIRHVYPEAYKADCETVKGDIKKLGNFTYAVHYWPDATTTIIFNMYSQYTYNASQRPFNYAAFEMCLLKTVPELASNKYSIGLPLIGFGLAGGDLERIVKIIHDIYVANEVDFEIVIWEGEKNPEELKEQVEKLFEKFA